MGLIRSTFRSFFLVSLLGSSIWGAPKLRLLTTTVGPVSVAANANGPLQTVEAYNAGDGALSLQASANVPWLTVSVGAGAACLGRGGTCYPVRIDPRTASLAKGIYTATVTVNDPNALDAPQTITVTIQMGGGVPDRLEQFVGPGRTVDTTISSNSNMAATSTTSSGGNWLSVAQESGGSFRAVYNYQVRMAPAVGTPEGTYNGTVTFSRSALVEENKAMPAVMRVTNGAILRVPAGRASLRLRQGSGKGLTYVAVTNDGSANLTLNSYSASTTSGGNWLSAETPPFAGFIQVNADTTGLAPGRYDGEVRANSNAANSPSAIPVTLEVVAQGAPLASYGGIVNVGSYDPDDTLAPGTWVEMYGEQFTTQTSAPQAAPFPTILGGTRVLVNGVAAPIWISTAGQINFQVPYNTAAGEAVVRVERDGQAGNALSVRVADSAPRIRLIRGTPYCFAFNSTDGALAAPSPLLGLPARPVRRGEYLVVYVVGFGQTSPPVQSGIAAPLEPLARVPGNVRIVFGSAIFGGVRVDTIFAGLTPGFSGLYQINVQVPNNAPVGVDVPIAIETASGVSPAVRIAIQ